MTGNESEDYKWWTDEEVIDLPTTDSMNAQWWADKPEHAPLPDEDWWTLPQHETVDILTPDNSAIGRLDLSQYLPKPGEFANPKFAIPIPHEAAEHPDLLHTFKRDLEEGHITGYELYDPDAQWTEKWKELSQQDAEAGKHVYFIATPLYLVKVFLPD